MSTLPSLPPHAEVLIPLSFVTLKGSGKLKIIIKIDAEDTVDAEDTPTTI